MSTRELQEAIKARDEALAKVEKAEKKEKKLQKDLDFANKKLKMEQEGHERQIENAKKEAEQRLEQIKRLQTELDEAEGKGAVSDEAQAEIDRLKVRLAKAEQLGVERLAEDEETARFKILYQTVQNNFSDMMDTLCSIKNEGAKEKRKAAVKALLDRFAEVLEE